MLEGAQVSWEEAQVEESAAVGPSAAVLMGVGAEARTEAAASAYVQVVRKAGGPVFWAVAEVTKAWSGVLVLHQAD